MHHRDCIARHLGAAGRHLGCACGDLLGRGFASFRYTCGRGFFRPGSRVSRGVLLAIRVLLPSDALSSIIREGVGSLTIHVWRQRIVRRQHVLIGPCFRIGGRGGEFVRRSCEVGVHRRGGTTSSVRSRPAVRGGLPGGKWGIPTGVPAVRSRGARRAVVGNPHVRLRGACGGSGTPRKVEACFII